MNFLAPERLILLLPLAALVILFAWKRRKPSITHPLLQQIAARLRPASRWIYLPRALELLALAALLPALLSPVLPLARYAVINEGLDIILTVDLSGSMQEPMDMIVQSGRMRIRPDQDRTRLEAVKDAMIQFAKSRRTDRLGVVVFSEQGYVVAPLTNDLPYVLRYLSLIDTATLASEGQTAIGEGVWTAMVHARSQSPASAGGKGKVIIVLTDGENNAGRDPVEAIRVAGAAGFRVHFIGVEIEQAKNAQQIIESVARTGGNYYDVNKEVELQQAYADIDKQEKARFITNTEMRNVPNHAPFVLAAFVLLVTAQLLRTLRYFTEVS